jgi:hypothetical protein
VAKILLVLSLGVLAGVLLSPMFVDLSTYGTHDWDSAAVHRYVTVESIKRYHEGPWWHPWLCGGFAAWAYADGATNFASPLLPVYLLAPIQIALRVEVIVGVVAGLVGAYLFASRFTRSIALRGLVVALFMFNGRWALQASVGHDWHLLFAYMPLALYFLDKSFEPNEMRNAVYAGIVVAWMVYGGGIYPVPHTALAMGLYAAATAAATRTWRPFTALALAGSSGIGFAAPKLVPIMDLMRRFPRKLESVEAYDLKQTLLMMTQPNPDGTGYLGYGWHEFGIYVGWAGTAVVLFALFFGRGPKVLPLRILGIVFFVLGLGAFLPYAPWTLLHKLPPFSSQHVPSRFTYPAILFLAAAFAASMRRVERSLERWPWIDLVLLVPVVVLGASLVSVATQWMGHMFYLKAPPVEHEPQFRQALSPPANYVPPDAWAGASMLSVYANTGFIGCYSVPERGDPKGAIASDDPSYKGEAYVLEGSGEARTVAWTPNSAEIEVRNATPGAILVYNMNYEPSWRANDAPAIEYRHAVAARISAPSQRIKFSYYPRTLNASIVVFLITCFACFGRKPATRLVEAWRRRARAARRSLVTSVPPIG